MKRGIKTKKKKKSYGSLILALIAIIGLGIFLNYNLNRKNNKDLEKWTRYAIIGRNNVIVVYEDKLSVKIPFDVQVNKETTLEDLVKTKNYKMIMESINNFLPEKVENYKVIKYGKVDIKTKNSRNIPEMVIDDQKFVLTSGTQAMFSDLYGNKRINSSNLVVDILNANGIGGYARRTGEQLKKDFNITYTAANYENNTEYSLIKINNIPKDVLDNILTDINEKYFKVKENTDIPTLASVVLVLGKEKNIDFKIDVKGTGDQAKLIEKELIREGYKNIILKNEIKGIEQPVIEYNKEDYYTAIKLSKKLKIANMLENNSLRNKINILVN